MVRFDEKIKLDCKHSNSAIFFKIQELITLDIMTLWLYCGSFSRRILDKATCHVRALAQQVQDKKISKYFLLYLSVKSETPQQRTDFQKRAIFEVFLGRRPLDDAKAVYESSSPYAGFCPEIKSIGTNGPLSLKNLGHFRKYGALVNFPYMTSMVSQHLDKLKRLRNSLLNYS